MLTRDTPRVWELGEVNAWPLAPQTTIFQGAAVGDNGSGLARPLQAGDKFLGFCEAFVSNLPPSPAVPAAQGDNSCARLLTSGLVELDVTGVKATSFGVPIYASDDNTFTLNGPPNSFIGTVHRPLLNGKTIVAFGHHVRSGVASHTVVFAGSHKTTGGNVMEKVALSGLLPSDVVTTQLNGIGKTPCTIKLATATANSLHVTFDNDPSTDHVVAYLVHRTVT